MPNKKNGLPPMTDAQARALARAGQYFGAADIKDPTSAAAVSKQRIAKFQSDLKAIEQKKAADAAKAKADAARAKTEATAKATKAVRMAGKYVKNGPKKPF